MRLSPLLLSFLIAMPSHAAVKMAGDALQADIHPSAELREGQSFLPVRVDREAIEAVTNGGELVLPGVGNQATRVRFDSLTRRDDGLSVWVGKVDTAFGPQSVVLTLGNGLAFGLIPQPEGPPLRLETWKGRTWLVEGLAPDPGFESPAADFRLPPVLPGSRAKRAQQDGLKVLPAPVVDVLVLYNATLVNVMGSDAAVQARIVQLEAISNQAYIDSLSDVRIRVVAKHLVDYAINNDNDDALDAITDPSALAIKVEVDRLRTLYAADLVSLVRNFDRSTQNSCGIAWLGGYHGNSFNAGNGFSVVSDRGFGGDNCGEWTFAHELGHNMGAHHDTETTEGDYGAYTYSRGFRQTVSSTTGFATVMAYSVSPQVRNGYFSNPRISACLSLPCGDAATADNARGLTDAAPAMASLVASLPATTLPGLSIDDVSVTEGNTGTKTVSFVVRLSAASATPVTFTLKTMDGSALAPTDYVARTISAQIPAGQTSASFDVTLVGDTLVEQNEIFAINASNAVGARIIDGQGVATITNDEPIPDLTIADVSVDEGNASTTAATFTVSLSQASNTPVTFSADSFRYAAGPNAATEAVDFQHIALDNLVIPAGATTAQFSANVIGDIEVEQDESFYVNLSNVTAANVVDGRSNVWIRNDDGIAGRPTISIGTVAVAEGNAGTSLATFTITLSQASTGIVRFGAATSNGTAQAGTDYVSKLVNSQSIATGQLSTTFAVTINGDTAPEPNETFIVSLFNITGADRGTTQAIGTLNNDDGSGLPAFATRDDRVVLRENAPAAMIGILANDAFDAARLAGGTLTITTAPAQGTATILNNGTGGTVADDTLRYIPAANHSGEVLVGYRLCEGSGGRCADGVLSVTVRPSLDVLVESASGSGFQDLAMADLRALPAAEFIATRLVKPEILDSALAVDATPESPWDNGRAGTQFVTRTLTPAGATPEDWRVLVDARSVTTGDVDVYLGVDTDGDSTPDANEVRCTAAMSAAAERCEMAVSAVSPSTRYWIMAHNRSNATHTARLHHYAVQLVPDHNAAANTGRLTATGPGKLPADADFPLRLGWTDLTAIQGDSRLGFVRVKSNASTEAGLFPVRIDRTGAVSPPIVLQSTATAMSLASGAVQERMFVDVPAGATQLVVTTDSSRAIDVHIVGQASPTGPGIQPAPAPGTAIASAIGVTGNRVITINAIAAGRWYVRVQNSAGGTTDLTVRATVAAAAPVVRNGSYYNAARGGHGLFLYPAGAERVGLWYTYLQDGSPTWYYLQGPAPAANGLWTGTLYRSAWTGTTNKLTAIGQAKMAPTGQDAFVFTYTLDGETGAEPLVALGRGCPSLAGSALDVSSHWYSASAAGSGYSVQMFPTYEFYTAFVYDSLGVPRYLLAERNGFGGASAALDLVQLKGFCPLCTRTGNPTRATVGVFNRTFSAGSFSNITMDAIYADGIPGAWSTNHAVQTLGGAGTTQSCVVP